MDVISEHSSKFKRIMGHPLIIIIIINIIIVCCLNGWKQCLPAYFITTAIVIRIVMALES